MENLIKSNNCKRSEVWYRTSVVLISKSFGNDLTREIVSDCMKHKGYQDKKTENSRFQMDSSGRFSK